MKCIAAIKTENGWDCKLSDQECLFVNPDSKRCAEMYNEGPDYSFINDETNNELEEKIDDEIFDECGDFSSDN